MKIAISGASGFIGSYLSSWLAANGYEVLPLGRSAFTDENKEYLANVLMQSTAVINLAGAPINHRWTKQYRQEVFSSRIDTTTKIVSAINSIPQKPKLLISASAVGYYPSFGCYDEYSAANGDGFLAQLTSAWEAEAQKLSPDVRLVSSRFAMVLSPNGGVLKQLLRTTKFGIVGLAGNGRHPFPWIALEDLCRAMVHIINTDELQGVVNFVTPEQLTHKQLMNCIAKHYGCLAISIPKLFFKIILGKASELICEGQCVAPTKLTASGFKFSHSSLLQFLSNIR